MTPTELVTYIRQRHNVVGDSFWSDQEILNLVWAACFEMSREGLVIEATPTSSTVIGTRAYAIPSNTIAIKRVTYNGEKLQRIDFREDDQITGQYESSTSQGNSQYYSQWNGYIYLRPIPSAVVTLQFYTFKEPSQITTTSTLEIPTQFHLDTLEYALAAMHAKEQNFAGSKHYEDRWQAALAKIKAWQRKRLRTDGFTSVKDMDSISASFLGVV